MKSLLQGEKWMFDDFVADNDEVRIRTNHGSEVFGRLQQVDRRNRMFIVKASDCEGRYLVPFDAVLCIRVEHAAQPAVAV